MARVNFGSDFNSYSDENQSNSIKFFSLKDDGDYAIVRFMDNSTNDFEILTTHPITLNGKFRSVSCIRGPHDEMNKCPLCESGAKLNRKFFIKLIRYDVVDGRITPTPCVWERTMNYAYTLKDYIDAYGSLSGIVCKIVRHGKAKSMDTKYEIIPNLNPSVYTEDAYPIDMSAFKDYSALGTIVIDRSASDISEFLATGNFPQTTAQQNASSNDGAQSQLYQQQTYNSTNFTPVEQSYENKPLPWENTGNASSVSRPVRYY